MKTMRIRVHQRRFRRGSLAPGNHYVIHDALVVLYGASRDHFISLVMKRFPRRTVLATGGLARGVPIERGFGIRGRLPKSPEFAGAELGNLGNRPRIAKVELFRRFS